MASTDTADGKPITRDDLERKFRGLQESLQGEVEDRRSTLMTVAIAGGFVLLVLVFLFGKRSGKRKKTVVEIRRL